MNTKILIGLIAVLVVAGGAWLLLGGESAEAPSTSQEPSDRNTSTVTSSSNSSINESFSGTGSFMDLLGLGQSVTCDFTHEAETGSAVAGTVRVANGKMRSDFEMQQANTVYESHFIQDDTYFYTWSETPEGSFAMKAPVEDMEAAPGANSGGAERPVDLDSDVEYDCQPWRADASVFVPPNDIEFVTPNEMMQNMMQDYSGGVNN
jgi:hypothetical protein